MKQRFLRSNYPFIDVICPKCGVWGLIFESQAEEEINCGACRCVFRIRRGPARNAEIVRLYRGGHPRKTIAKLYGMTTSNVDKIVAKWEQPA